MKKVKRLNGFQMKQKMQHAFQQKQQTFQQKEKYSETIIHYDGLDGLEECAKLLAKMCIEPSDENGQSLKMIYWIMDDYNRYSYLHEQILNNVLNKIFKLDNLVIPKICQKALVKRTNQLILNAYKEAGKKLFVGTMENALKENHPGVLATIEGKTIPNVALLKDLCLKKVGDNLDTFKVLPTLESMI